VSIFSLLAQRYYELANAKEIIIKEEFLLVKIVTAVYSTCRIALLKAKEIKKDLIVIVMWATVAMTKSSFERSW
jgi:hypothetical protein